MNKQKLDSFGLCPQNDKSCHLELVSGSLINVKGLFTHSPIHLFTSKKCASNSLPSPPPREGKAAFTLAEDATHVTTLCKQRKCAFTLAEVLITLGIIGVVAAITMPSIIAHHQKKVTVNKLKKAYSTLSQMAIKTYSDNGPASDFLTTDEANTANKSQKFFEIYWLPYFNFPIVKNSFYTNPFAYTQLNEKKWDSRILTDYKLGRISFSTQDGTIYSVSIIKLNIEKDSEGNITSQTYVYSDIQNVYVDINGTKGPNQLGKDVFMFDIDFKKNMVTPECADYDTDSINRKCHKNGSGTCCAAKIIKDGWQIAPDYPW